MANLPCFHAPIAATTFGTQSVATTAFTAAAAALVASSIEAPAERSTNNTAT